MKNLIKLTGLLSVLMIVTSTYGGYRELVDSFDRYSPPLYFQGAVTSMGPVIETFEAADPQRTLFESEIAGLRQESAKSVSLDGPVRFLAGTDEKQFAGLKDKARDTAAVQAMLQDHGSLEMLEILSVLRSPAIQSAREKIEGEIVSFDQVQSLDNQLRQYAGFTRGLNPSAGPVKMNDSVAMGYPFPGLTSLKARIVSEQVLIWGEKHEIAVKKVITDVRKAYWELVFNSDSTRITSETIEALNRLKEVATVLYKSGKTSFQDVIKINIQIAILDESLVTFAREKKTIEIRILNLLDLPESTRMASPGIVASSKRIPEPETLYKTAMEQSQELNLLRHRISKTQTMVEMGEMMKETPFTLNLSLSDPDVLSNAGTGAKKPAFADRTMAAMKNGSPAKPWYGLDEPWLEQTRKNILSLKHDLSQARNTIISDIREAWVTVDRNQRELNLYKGTILPLSKSALDVSSKEYEAGSIAFSQAIDSYTYWLKVQLLIASKTKDLGIAVARLEMLRGKSF